MCVTGSSYDNDQNMLDVNDTDRQSLPKITLNVRHYQISVILPPEIY
jgi:hypothetical protein